MLANMKNPTIAHKQAGKGGSSGGAIQSGVAESCLTIRPLGPSGFWTH